MELLDPIKSEDGPGLLEYALFEAEYVDSMVDRLIEITAVKDGEPDTTAVQDGVGELDEGMVVTENILIPVTDHDYSATLSATEFPDFTELTPIEVIDSPSVVSQLPSTATTEGKATNYVFVDNCIDKALVEHIISTSTSTIPNENIDGFAANQKDANEPLRKHDMNVDNFDNRDGMEYFIEPIREALANPQQHSNARRLTADVTSFTDPECSRDSGIGSTSPGYLDDLNSLVNSPVSVPDVGKPRTKSTGSSPETILPPCRICGGKPSGLHYGAVTCEACKGFFRRTLRKKTVKFKCICNDEKRKRQKDRRTKQEDPCQACRYQRCLAAGMSTNAIKIGRYTLDRKTQNILEVKKLERKQINSNSDKSFTEMCRTVRGNTLQRETELKSSDGLSVIDSRAIITPSFTAGSSDGITKATIIGPVTKSIDAALAAAMKTTDVFSGALEEISLEDVVVVEEEELGVDELDEIVKTLVERHYCLMEPWLKDSKIKDLKEQQVKYLEEYQLKKQMFGNMDTLSKEEYFNFYNSTGIDIDNRQELVKEGLAFFQRKIIALVEFAKAIPEFKDICLHDQANLIKSSRLDSQMIGTSNRVFQSDFGITTTPWGKCYHIDEIGKVFPIDFVLLKLKLVKKIKKLSLSAEEEAVIRALAVASSDRCDLDEPEKCHRIQCKMLKCLLHVLKKREGNPNTRLSKIMDILITLRALADTEAKILKELCLEWPMFSNHTFVREFIT